MLTKKLLKNKNFYLLMGYQLFAGMAHKLFQFCIPWFVYDLTGSATQMVLTFGVTMAPYLIFCFLGGTLVDYFNRRTMLLVTATLSTITLLVFSCTMIYGANQIDLEIVYVLCFLLATYNALDISALDAMIVDYFEKDELISINSTIEVILSTCNIAGPLAAGVMIKILGSKYAILSIAFMYACAFALMKTSKPTRTSSACKKFGSLGEFLYEHCQLTKEGFDYLFTSNNPILLIIMVTFFSNIITGSYSILITYIARDTWGMSSESFASIISIGAACSLIFTVFFAYKFRKYHIFSIMGCMLFIDAIASSAIGMSDIKFISLGFYCLMMSSDSLYNIFGRTFRQKYVTPSYMGRVTGVSRSLIRSAAPLSAIISAALLDFISVKFFFITGGILATLLAGVFYHLQKRFNPVLSNSNA